MLKDQKQVELQLSLKFDWQINIYLAFKIF